MLASLPNIHMQADMSLTAAASNLAQQDSALGQWGWLSINDHTETVGS
jgi:hypothetical protein